MRDSIEVRKTYKYRSFTLPQPGYGVESRRVSMDGKNSPARSR